MQLSIEKVDEKGRSAYLVARGVNTWKFASRCHIFDHRAFLRMHTVSDDLISFSFSGTQPPAFLMTGDDLSKRIDKEYIPQLMSAMLHVHKRGMVLCNVNSKTIAIAGSNIYFIDISESCYQTGISLYKENMVCDLYHAPETHLYHRFMQQSDYYGLALWWISAKIRRLVEDWGQEGYMGVHSMAMREATTLQSKMLALDPVKRLPLQDIFTSFLETQLVSPPAVTTSRSNTEFQLAVTPAFDNAGDAFAALTAFLQSEKVAEKLDNLRALVPIFLVNAMRLCPSRGGVHAVEFRQKFSSLLEFISRFMDVDRDHWLNNVSVQECCQGDDQFPKLANLLVIFASIHSNRACRIVEALCERNIFKPSSGFLKNLCETEMESKDIMTVVKIASQTKHDPLMGVMDAIMSRGSLRDSECITLRRQLEEKTRETEERVKALESAIKQKDDAFGALETELEEYRTVIAAAAGLYERKRQRSD